MSMKEIRTGDTVYILRGIVLRAENASEGKVVSVSGNEAVVSSEGQAYTFTVSAVVDPETSGKCYRYQIRCVLLVFFSDRNHDSGQCAEC